MQNAQDYLRLLPSSCPGRFKRACLFAVHSLQGFFVQAAFGRGLLPPTN